MCQCHVNKQCKCGWEAEVAKATPALKLTVGKKYLTRNKIVVEIIKTNTKIYGWGDLFTILGVMFLERGASCQAYKENGRSAGSGESDYDIVSEYKEPEYRWFNVYRTFTAQFPDKAGNNNMNKTKAEADVGAGKPDQRIAVCRVDINTGEVTQEPL